MALTVTPSGSAADIAAQLLRAQFSEWESTFQPIELAAMNQISYNNPGVLTKAVGTATDTATETAEAMPGIQNRQQSALGITPTAQQATVSKRLMDLNKAASVAGAENTARANVRGQDEQILLGNYKGLSASTLLAK